MTDHAEVGVLTVGRLTTVPARSRLDLVADPVRVALEGWEGGAEVGVVEIDPDLADTAALSEAFDLPLAASGNCVVVGGRRDGVERVAGCVVRADTRADVNTLIRKRLDVRKASFLAMDQAVAESGMEYGGITPLGLPSGWRLFVDAALLDQDAVVVGSGLRRSKLFVPGRLLAEIPGAEVVAQLGR
jgi:prolyl-tRNA editing enzyme YbaK/EbsC (Cys-tRNA(Pro) deacylase)